MRKKRDIALVKFIKNIFEVPDSYRNLVNCFGKSDAFIAIILFLLYGMAMALSGILVNYVSSNQITYIGGLTNLIFVGIVLFTLKIRKQGLDTIGLRKGNIKLSLIMGITLSVILFFCNCLSNILFEKQSFIPVKEIMMYILYFFTVGLVEEAIMKKILVTGGTTFVSKYVAEYFVTAGYEVYVLNRNTKPQVRGVKLIEGDRHNLGNILKDIYFDVVADITAYNAIDIIDLVEALGSFEQYIMISSSAVYPEHGVQPFLEESEKSVNKFWGTYGTDKIEAENALLNEVSDAYILRPPYLYGPMNNVYREAFVFDCALADRKFYLPKDGDMKLQFFHVKDLCRLMEVIIKDKPDEHIINVGNKEAVSIKEWVIKCYESLGKTPTFVNVYEEIEQRNYFSFYNYEYYLDVTRQSKIYPETISLEDGLKDAAKWYLEHKTEVNKKPYFEYIDSNFLER